MSAAQKVVNKFGGQTQLAEVLGIRQSAVSYWVKTGNIPAKRHAAILRAAGERNLDLSPRDLVNGDAVEVLDRADDIPHAIARGDLTVGEDDGAPAIACYVLSDGRRVISRTSALGAIASSSDHTVGGDLQSYVKHIERFMRVKLEDELIEFRLDNVTHKRVAGVTAECFLDVCRAYVRARDTDGGLTTDRQHEIAIKANAFLSACANVGLIALIDEATGYQYMRAEDALRVKLRAYLEEEMRPWEKTFPDELWIEFGRLTGWKGSVQHRPKYWGKLVNELVYEYLDPDVYEWLRANAPPPRHGQNYHQWLSANYGLRKLIEHIWMLVGMASACTNMTELRTRMAERYGKQPVQMILFLDPPTNAR